MSEILKKLNWMKLIDSSSGDYWLISNLKSIQMKKNALYAEIIKIRMMEEFSPK